MRIALLLEYRGTSYAGWQRQTDKVTVQGTLEDALKLVTGECITTCAAGRTDAGVHALGQVVHFDTNVTIPAQKYKQALESFLPATISIRESVEVSAVFHARHDAVDKTYCYRIAVSPFSRATLWDTHFVTKYALFPALMRRAATLLVGTHDFATFYTQGSSATTTVRSVKSVEVKVLAGNPNTDGKVEEGEIIISITADGFLYNMVRVIVAQLLQIGQGRRPAEDMATMLEARNRAVAKEMAPSSGLYLARVTYPQKIFEPTTQV